WIGNAGRIDADRIRERMGRAVPATHGEIEPAGKSDAVIDHDDLLVTGRAGGHAVVEAELDLRRRPPLQREGRQGLALEGIDQGIVPQKQLDGEMRLPPYERTKKLAKSVRQVVAGFAVFSHEARAAVDVPANNVDRPVGVAHGASQCGEILGRVDEYRSTVGAFD